MSRMSELDWELQRMSELDVAVRNYLSHLYAFEQGAEENEMSMLYWRDKMETLTSDERFEYRPEDN